MTIDPKTSREVAIDLQGFKAWVDDRFGTQRWLLGAIGTVLVAIVGGGFAIYAQIGDFRAEVNKTVGELKATASASARDLAAMNERVAKLEKSSAEILAAAQSTATILSRIESKLAGSSEDQGPFAPLVLNPVEEQLIREVLEIKGFAKIPSRYSLGDPVPIAATKPLPESLMKKVPRLKGAKFAVDGVWVIIAGAGNRVVAIVGPQT